MMKVVVPWVAIGIGVDQVMNVMNQKLDNEKKMMIAVNNVTSLFDVKILQPLLHEDFISYAKTIPISEKIIDPNDLQRKHAIRKLAASCGVPEISAYNKKCFRCDKITKLVEKNGSEKSC